MACNDFKSMENHDSDWHVIVDIATYLPNPNIKCCVMSQK